MHGLLHVLALLGAAMIFAKLLGGVFRYWGIPSVLAELITGIIVGNIGWQFTLLKGNDVVAALSEIGVLLLLFVVGLETDIKEIGKVGRDSALAALVGVVVPATLAFIFVPLVAEGDFNHTLFMATALTATSVGITARVLQDLGKLKSLSGRVILGAAVIDDILGIVILTVVTALVTQGSVSAGSVGMILLKVLFFGIGVVVLRSMVFPKTLIRVRPLEVSGSVIILLTGLMMILAYMAEMAGLAGIIGAFSLGIALDDVHFKGYKEKENVPLEHLLKPITDFLVPVFFIYTGMSVQLDALLNPDALALASTLIVVGIIGKMACGLALSRKSIQTGANRLLVGYGMIPRGEVGLIFASIGLNLKILNRSDYAAVVMMVAVTTLLAPILLAIQAKKVKA